MVHESKNFPVVETEVQIQTPDGLCDAAFLHPAQGAHPGVLIWPDAGGLRLSFRHMGKRLAAEGYSVLVPNPFYRSAKAPVFDISTFSFQNPDDLARLDKLRAPLTAAGATEKDAAALLGFLDSKDQVDKHRRMGTQGYCMGGALAFKTAAAVPDRIGACASFHGGGLATDKPESPHRLAPKIRARVYIAIAANDDAKQPEAKDVLRDAFAAARVPTQIEVYADVLHGWCVTDMPAQNGRAIYNHSEAERAWAKLLALYKDALR